MNLVVRRLGIAALIATVLLPVSAAQAQLAIPSPYAGLPGASPADTSSPVPRWNTQACVKAHAMKRRLDRLDSEVEGRLDYTLELILEDPTLSKSEVARRYAAFAVSLSQDADLLVAEAESAMAVLPDCTGLYLRSELEIYCDAEVEKRFGICAALDAKGPPGVAVTGNEDRFRTALAQQFFAGIERYDAPASVGLFEIGRPRLWFESPGCPSEGAAVTQSDAQEGQTAWLQAEERIEREAFGLYSVGRIGLIPKCDNGIGSGDWMFGFRTELYYDHSYSAADVQIEPPVLAAAGLSPKVGPFWQQPRFELQVGIPSNLIATPEAALWVEHADARRIVLSDAASIIYSDHVSFYDDQSNAASWFAFYPGIGDWQALTDSAAIGIVAQITVTGPDGKAHPIELRAPLHGFAAALGELAARRRAISADYQAQHAQSDTEQ